MRNLSGMRLARRGVEDLPPGSAVRPLSDEFRGPMNYAVKEIYYSLTSEDAKAEGRGPGGRPCPCAPLHFVAGLQGQDLATQMPFGEYRDAFTAWTGRAG